MGRSGNGHCLQCAGLVGAVLGPATFKAFSLPAAEVSDIGQSQHYGVQAFFVQCNGHVLKECGHSRVTNE